jgi:hypothetical protein
VGSGGAAFPARGCRKSAGTPYANAHVFDQSGPDWLSALAAYLGRDRDLDPRIGREPGAGTSPGDYPGLREFHFWSNRRLAARFRDFGCTRYVTWLTGGFDLQSNDLEFKGERPPINPTLEEESAALRAVLDWLSPLPTYPRFTTPKEREELLGLRRRAGRAAQIRLRQLEGGAVRDEQHERIEFDSRTQSVTLDGNPFPIDDPKAFEVYQAIADSCPHPLTRAAISSRVKGVHGGKKVRRLLDSLPEPLARTVLSGPNGYWLRLPKKRRPKKVRS